MPFLGLSSDAADRRLSSVSTAERTKLLAQAAHVRDKASRETDSDVEDKEENQEGETYSDTRKRGGGNAGDESSGRRSVSRDSGRDTKCQRLAKRQKPHGAAAEPGDVGY